MTLRDVVTSDERRAAYLAAGHWDDSTLPGAVAAHAAARPAAIAVHDEDGTLTYAELWEQALAVVGWLEGVGVTPGDVVSVQLPNRCSTAAVAVGILAAGGVVNPLLPNYRARELEHVFTTARPRAVITPPIYRDVDHVALIDAVRASSGVEAAHLTVDAGRPAVDGPAATAIDRDAADVSEIIFTSGTEAAPKAIMHTEQTTNFCVRTARDDMGLGAGDVVWMPSPVGHSTGFNYGLRLALYLGLPLVLQDRWDPVSAAALIRTHGCSYTLAATTFLQDLVETTAAAGERLDTLRCFGCGGAPVPPSLVAAADDVGITVLRLYGSTEVLVATWNRADSTPEQRRTTDGRAMSDVEVAVDAAGEVLVRGPNTCVGFHADPERTAATFDPDGWVRSGDLATMDDSHLTIVGRKKEIIIRGGMNITPREIEELIGAFPEVERVAVVGIPDERLGERTCACVVLRPGADLDLATTVERLRTQGMATYKLPERLERFDALPATASGKIQKHEIVRELESR